MRFTLSTPIIAMAVWTAATAELNRRTNGTIIIPLTKRPMLLPKADYTVNLNPLYLHVESLDTKFLRGLENYEKNMGIPHPLAMKGIDSEHLNSKRASVHASLTNFENRIWYTTIWIGTPPKRFTVQIDTGSDDLFVPGPTCSYCEGHAKWDPASSQTSKDEEVVFNIKFTDGDVVSGKQYRDNVTITGLTADKQTICVATTYSPDMGVNSFPPDGLLGMAFQSVSALDPSDTPLFETLINEGKVEEPVFSIKPTSSGGELYLGGSNTDLYTGEITYTDVTVWTRTLHDLFGQGFWQVNIARIQGHGETLLTDVPAIIDTGATFIVGDLVRVRELHTNPNLSGKSVGRGFYSFPCNDLPAISFAFGGASSRMFQIPASLLNLGPVWHGSPKCFSGIVSGVRGRQHWTFGGVFLMSVYTIFDVGKKRVGFADLAT